MTTVSIFIAIFTLIWIFAYITHNRNIRHAAQIYSIDELNRWIDDMQNGYLPYNEQMLSDFIEIRNYKLKQDGEENQSE